MVYQKRKELFSQANKLSNGLGKIDEARSSVEIMTIDLEKAQVKGKAVVFKETNKITTKYVIKHYFSYGNSASV